MNQIHLLPTFAPSGLCIHAQEVVLEESMNNEEALTSYRRTDVSNKGSLTQGFKNNKPSEGEKGCLEVYGNGTSGIFVFREVNHAPRAKYTFDGVIKNISTEPLTFTRLERILFGKSTTTKSIKFK